MINQYMLLWFEAPLQSWGSDSKFYRRDTQEFPTKSGVLGLLCAASGLSGPQREFLATFAPLRQTAVSFDRMGKLAEPLLRDFHMVGGGYDSSDPWQSLMELKSASGHTPSYPSKVTNRYYLQDAAFAVVLEIPSVMVSAVSQALTNPVWDLYLGRKCCVPTEFIYQGVYDSETTALEAAVILASSKHREENFRVEDFNRIDQVGNTITLNDVPLQFGEVKQYRERRVVVKYAARSE